MSLSMVSIIEGFNNNVISNFQSFGATLVQFQKFDPQFGPGTRDDSQRNRKNLTYEDAEALKRLVPSMLAVSPERYWFSGGDSTVPDIVYRGEVATPDTIVGVPHVGISSGRSVRHTCFPVLRSNAATYDPFC